jgi:hypothetical protein
MRIPFVCMVLAFGLLSCRDAPRFVNADALARAPSDVSASTSCNALVQQGDAIDLRGSRTPAPTPVGGIVEDGVYVLTSTTLHTTDQLHDAPLVGLGRITMLVSGSISQLVRTTVDGRERHSTVNRESSGIVATLHTTCTSPSPTSDTTTMVSYTASGSSLQFITPGPAGTVVATYTKVRGAGAPSPQEAARRAD